jgi:hypothetical protein
VRALRAREWILPVRALVFPNRIIINQEHFSLLIRPRTCLHASSLPSRVHIHAAGQHIGFPHPIEIPYLA